MPRRNSILINFILDRSGSMEAVRDETISGVNHYLDSQRKQPGECFVTLAQFDDVYELLYNRVHIAHVAARSRENYVPRNWTALHDAMGRTIDETGTALAKLPEHERPERVLFVTQTDGLENASRVYTADMVRQKIEHQRGAYHWEFVFLGANQDAILTAKALGISQGSTMTYAANDIGTLAVMDSMAAHTNAYRATGMHVNFTRGERLFQANAGAHADAANDPHMDPDADTSSQSAA